MANEGHEVTKHLLSIRPGVPLSFTPATDEAADVTVTPEVRFKTDRLVKTLKAYLKAARDLVDGPYAELRDYVPQHMTQACTPMALLLDDGIIIRYDLVENPETKVRAGFVPGTITEWAHVFLNWSSIVRARRPTLILATRASRSVGSGARLREPRLP